MICGKNIEFPQWDETDNSSCVVDYCAQVMDKVRMESCGKSVLCREGTWQAYEIIRGIAGGDGRSDDIELLKELLEHIKRYESCNISRDGASLCLDLIEKYEDEWNKHLKRKICSNNVCKGMNAGTTARGSSDNQEGIRRRRRRGE